MNKGEIEKYCIEEEILLRHIRGFTSKEEDDRIWEWLKDNNENEKVLLDGARIYHAQRTKARIEKRDSHKAFQKTLQKRKSKQRGIYLKRIVSAAAISLFIFSVGINIFLYHKTSTIETQFVTVQTNAGMRTNINLPDGTLVYLNSASKLTYPVPYDPKERKVILEGEGFFEVKSNPDHPFIVSVANDQMRVKALGTSFNVNAYPEEKEIYTTLVEGSVVLQFTDAMKRTHEKQLNTSGEAMYQISSNHVILGERKIVPQDKATYNLPARKVSIKPQVNTANEYAWKEGKLIFKDTPMPEVLSKLSNFYNVKFEIKNKIIETYPFTGTFDNKQLFQVLNYFKLISKINYIVKETTEDDSNGTKHTVIQLDI